MVTTGNMVAAFFTHDTNREGEMHLHSHGLLFNVTRADDKWHALGSDTRQHSGIREQVYDLKLAYGQFYREFLRPMVEDCGYTPVRSGPHGMYEFAEVPPDVIRAFSQRTAQIDDAVGRDASPPSRSVAALDTRKNKEFVEGDARREQWDKVLSDYDFDPDTTIQAARERSRSQAAERGEAEAGSPASVTLTAEPALKEAITQALSSLSDKKAQFAYSEVLTAVVSLLPAEKDMVQRARAGIDTAIEQGRLIALDKDKGIFTSDIHVLDELTVRQFAREHMDSGRVIVTGEALLNGTLAAATGVYAELAESRDPLAIVYGRGGAAVQRERTERLAGLAVSQGRQVMVLAADRKSEAFLGENEILSGLIAGRGALKADLPLTAHTTVIVTEAETLGLKDSVFLMEKARESGAQILLMDSGKRQGTGSVLSVLQEEGAAHYRFNDAPVPVAQLTSEADKKSATAILPQSMPAILPPGIASLRRLPVSVSNRY
ncbi:MobF family relaxase [Erwinia tracheiphila]